MTRADGSYPDDGRSLLTIGKTNEKNIYDDFGRFQMDSFIVYYRMLNGNEISIVYGEGNLILTTHQFNT